MSSRRPGGEGLRRGPGPAQVGALVALAYLLVYLYSVQNLLVAPGLVAPGGVPSVAVLVDWHAKVWKPIAPFLWEPVVALYPLPGVALLVSPPNLLLGLLLAALLGANVGVVLARLGATGSFRRGGGGVVASVPALLSGFACCVPTLVLALGALGATFTVAVIAVRPFFVPLAVLALAANLVWGLRRLRCEVPAASRP
jgi:hypothetical protein